MLSNNNLFLNYNGFNNIKKSTSHIIKSKKNDVKLCDIANNCYNLEYNIKGKNIFDLSIELENLENTFSQSVYYNDLNLQYDSDSDTNTDTDTDTETLIDINIENFNNSNSNFNSNSKPDSNIKLNISKNNLKTFDNKIDLYQELLNYHMVIIILIIILMIYFLRK
jgi:hypothetical protein